MKNAMNVLVLFGMSGILFFSSCAKDDVGPDDPLPDDQFRGNWAVAENSKDFGKYTYNATITDSSNSSYLQIAYMYGLHKKTYATVNGSSMTIPSQIIAGVTLFGSGKLENSKRLSLTYYVQSTKTHYDTVTSVYTK